MPTRYNFMADYCHVEAHRVSAAEDRHWRENGLTTEIGDPKIQRFHVASLILMPSHSSIALIVVVPQAEKPRGNIPPQHFDRANDPSITMEFTNMPDEVCYQINRITSCKNPLGRWP